MVRGVLVGQPPHPFPGTSTRGLDRCQRMVDVVGKRRVGLDVRLQGAGEELLRHRLFDERPLGLHPAAASRKLPLQIGNDATVGPGNEADQLVGRTAFTGDDAGPRAAVPILRPPIRGQGVGIIDQQAAISFGLTGPLLRATGIPYDVRKNEPYLVYDRLDFDVPTGTSGDNYDRYMVRFAEMQQSMRILEQAMAQIPDGPIMITDPRFVLPPKQQVYGSIEGLMNHFKLVIEGQKVPPGEVYYPVEGPRGEYGVFLVADGSAKPVRVHMRDPSFVNLQALREMCVGGYVADLIANLAMLDPILGGIDR